MINGQYSHWHTFTRWDMWIFGIMWNRARWYSLHLGPWCISYYRIPPDAGVCL